MSRPTSRSGSSPVGDAPTTPVVDQRNATHSDKEQEHTQRRAVRYVLTSRNGGPSIGGDSSPPTRLVLFLSDFFLTAAHSLTVSSHSPYRPSSPHGSAQVSHGKSVRPFRGAAEFLAQRDGADAQCQTDPLPGVEPLSRLLGSNTVSPAPNVINSYASATRRSLELERVSILDLERRIEQRREALVSTGVLSGSGNNKDQQAVRLVPEPPAKPLAKPRPARLRKNSLSGEYDFIAFDSALPVPPASPSEEGRPKGPTLRRARGSPSGGARGRTPSPASGRSPNSPSDKSEDGDASEEKYHKKNSSGGIAIPSGDVYGTRSGYSSGASPTEKGGRGRRSRVPSPGANGTLHFGAFVPQVSSPHWTNNTYEKGDAVLGEHSANRNEDLGLDDDDDKRLLKLSAKETLGVVKKTTPRARPVARRPLSVDPLKNPGLDTHTMRDEGNGKSLDFGADSAGFKSFTRTASSAFAVVTKDRVEVLEKFELLSLEKEINGGDEKNVGGSNVQKSVLTMSLRGSGS